MKRTKVDLFNIILDLQDQIKSQDAGTIFRLRQEVRDLAEHNRILADEHADMAKRLLEKNGSPDLTNVIVTPNIP
jgi:regulator of replication initiation timing